ncbi:aminotransferase class I/II-fold pyridoxal phosphate-dependent enzyme [Rathayibacter sp. ZW T2_19]|uniref:cysteine-S-conjugate beta-lyase n=1 Tax=Rathayibacter rubneri TaxID=2950106 RepID=A0A9X2DUN3_9MICO|nr:aminotransferase class I/II-fold pyridoxal phosphate-dependent enzyme [Rathayibacter rubneri]MCM6761522.1 aminotransferase class I/II-fold pyridoxal phosphate-dependent enzyme [Rathayibacter rubneri]
MTVPFDPLEDLALADLRRRTSQKWRGHSGDVLPLWVAEMDVRLAPPIEEALHAALSSGDTGYASGAGFSALAEAVASFAAERWRWDGFPVGATRVFSDVMTGIVEVLEVSSSPGDAVVVASPVYAPFFSYIGHSGREVVETPLSLEGRLDLDAIEEALQRLRDQRRRTVLLLCNPHNPTGTVPTRAELEGVAALAQRYGVRVLADEIHGPLTLAGAVFTPYLSVAGADDAIAFTSASKGWNLAGLKAALATAGPAAARDLAGVRAEIDYAPSHLGVLAHTVAFREGGDWLDALLASLDRRRTLLGELLAEHLPQLSWRPPEGTYLAWIDCRALALSETGPRDSFAVATDLDGAARVFADEAGVAVNSGHIFGRGGAGFIRLNFATSAEILTTAVSRMGDAVRAPGAH